jgi:hypothetical protein
LANTTTKPNNRIGKFFIQKQNEFLAEKQPLMFSSFSVPAANLVCQENLVILLQDQMNQPLANNVLKDFIKAPRRALNVLPVRMDSSAMLFNKQAYLRAKIAAKEHIWIRLDNQCAKIALLENLEMWKEPHPFHLAQSAQVKSSTLFLLWTSLFKFKQANVE